MPRNETVLWEIPSGVKCVVAPYDETRYQLRLARPEGTIKADVFATWAEAIAAADGWRAEVNERRSGHGS